MTDPKPYPTGDEPVDWEQDDDYDDNDDDLPFEDEEDE